MMNQAIYSSATVEWETPQDVFDRLNDEFHFTLDPCCTHENAKCKKHYTKAENGLTQDWTGETVYCNPPYGREMPKWIEKCADHAKRGGDGGYADSSPDGHQSVSQMDLPPCGNPFPQRAIEIRQQQELSAVSFHDCSVQTSHKGAVTHERRIS